jgi:uncharacterized metal-binding protein YceD (DUF177 family)
MKDLKEFDIAFAGLKEGLHQFEYKIDNSFFEIFEYDEFNRATIEVGLSFLRKATLFELDFTVKGDLELACDLTNEWFDQPVSGSLQLVVKFGDTFRDEGDDILVIPHNENKINVAQYIYETIILGVPLKRVHPGVLDGSLKSPVLDKLKSLEIENDENKNKQGNDPRWDKLKNLIKKQ